MAKKVYHVIGVMSGTSLDGVDVAYVRFECLDQKWSFAILEAITYPYSEYWYSELSNAIHLDQDELKVLDIAYTEYLGALCRKFIEKYEVVDLDAVCSHGHTVFHKPNLGYTFQLGNLSNFSNWVDVKVVCDFRVQDVALGGQGAPLVPIGDRLLFSEYDACLNLGGFANVSYDEKDGNRIAFDIIAVNTVMNETVKVLGMNFDKDGSLAKKGDVNQELLAELNTLGFYRELPPKSLGIEYVNENLFPIIKRYDLNTKDLLRTFVEHIAIQINKGIPKDINRVLVTGGGVYNTFLMERIRANSSNEFYVPESIVVEFKEALVFGFLGVLRLEGQINVLCSVTGASIDHSSGVVY